MTRPASLEALAVVKTYFDECRYNYRADTHSVNTILGFGFFGNHNVRIVAHATALRVSVEITERIPPGFEDTVKRFGNATGGRISLTHTGVLEWSASCDPDDVELSEDVDSLFAMILFEVSVIEGYLDRYAQNGRLPGDFFLNGLADGYAFGRA